MKSARLHPAAAIGSLPPWIAGKGSGFHDHADGLNTDATFYYPRGVAIDTNGNLFVADGLNYLVRKITPSGSNWMTSTIAGQAGQRGGSDGVGTNSQFEFPAGVVADSNGNVFVADADGDTIRELTPSGTNYSVSTPLGQYLLDGASDGANNSALFNELYGVTLDKSGDLIISDTDNSEIRKATPAGTNWAVTTLAGFGANVGGADGVNGAARFNQPFGIAVDSSSNLYVADNLNSTIRKITPSGTNWTVSTIAGVAGDLSFGDGFGTNWRCFFIHRLLRWMLAEMFTSPTLLIATFGNSPPPAAAIRLARSLART